MEKGAFKSAFFFRFLLMHMEKHCETVAVGINDEGSSDIITYVIISNLLFSIVVIMINIITFQLQPSVRKFLTKVGIFSSAPLLFPQPPKASFQKIALIFLKKENSR